MVFKKPYAFFIRIFKPIHLFLAFLLSYLIYIQNSMVSYFSNYIHNANFDVTVRVNSFIYIIPVLFIIISSIVLGIMAKKSKPYKFYVFTILFSLVIIVINAYTSNFYSQLSDNTLPVKLVRFAHDLALLNIAIESFIFSLLLIRGLGVDIRKFDFSSDLLKLDISESDREEFEVIVNIDTDLQKRRRKGKIRNLKYKYLERKNLYNIIFSLFSLFLIFTIVMIILKSNPVKKPNYEYISSELSFKINNTYIIDKNYKGNDIDNLIVVDVALLSGVEKIVDITDFNLIIGDVAFNPVTNYSNSLIDIGVTYTNDKLSNTYTDYLIVFNVPKKYLDNKIILEYKDIKIKLKPSELKSESKNITYNIGDEASFTDSLGDVKFKITEFDIQKYYLINYDYCRNDYCLSSIEYLKPSINQNFDKAVIRIKVEFANNTNISLVSFYDLLNRFGILMYDGKIQNKYFEDIKSTKKNTGYIYIGVNNEVLNSSNIKLVFNIRNVNLEYVLRG